MSKKNPGAEEAAKARADEEARQARIRAGTERINGIFDGTTVGDGAIGAGTAFNPTGAYYNADGSRWTPTPQTTEKIRQPVEKSGFRLGGRDAGPQEQPRSKVVGTRQVGETPEQQFARLQAEGKLFGGTKKSGGFDEAFFTGRRDAYSNFATPQLEDQYGKANKELAFSLDRGGLLDSSVRGEKLSELQKLYDLQKQQIADKALSYETTARNSVEDARAGLISTLNATGDAEGAASAALARSQALSAPADYSSLGQLFTDFTAGLGTQAAQERSYAAGGPKPAYNTGLFGNAGRVAVS